MRDASRQLKDEDGRRDRSRRAGGEGGRAKDSVAAAMEAAVLAVVRELVPAYERP